MTAPTIDGQLMCACEWAYAITGSGPVPAYAPYDGGSGLSAPVQGFATGSNRIDAALVGSCASGVVVAFRGTLPPDSPDRRQTLNDWLRDLEIGLATGNSLPGRVHQGFLGALDALWPDVLDAVTTQMALLPVKHLFITGHSKGGAVAHLAAARFAMANIVHGSDITVRTFEGAHPGNAVFADTYQRQVADVVRYEYTDDLVPHLPPTNTMREIFQSEPLFQPLMPISDDVDYAPAGSLSFIDWDGNLDTDTALLRTKRLFHLAQCIAGLQFDQIVDDHRIGCGSGSMAKICPNSVCP